METSEITVGLSHAGFKRKDFDDGYSGTWIYEGSKGDLELKIGIKTAGLYLKAHSKEWTSTHLFEMMMFKDFGHLLALIYWCRLGWGHLVGDFPAFVEHVPKQYLLDT